MRAARAFGPRFRDTSPPSTTALGGLRRGSKRDWSRATAASHAQIGRLNFVSLSRLLGRERLGGEDTNREARSGGP